MATVLVVDADPLVLSTVKCILTAFSHRVLCASDPDQAVAIAHEQPSIDLMMVNFSSDRTGRQIVERVLLVFPNARVLRTSTGVENDLRESGLMRDSAHFIAKPFSAQQLADAVESALSDRAANKGAAGGSLPARLTGAHRPR